MATNLNPISPDALLKIVELVKKYYVEPPPQRHRGRPRTFSGLAFQLLTVVGVVLHPFKPQELATLLTKDATLRQALGFGRVPHRRTIARRLDAIAPEAEAQVQTRGTRSWPKSSRVWMSPKRRPLMGGCTRPTGRSGISATGTRSGFPRGCVTWTWSRRGPRVAIAAGGKAIAWSCKGWSFPPPCPSLPAGVPTRWEKVRCWSRPWRPLNSPLPKGCWVIQPVAGPTS